MWNLRDSRTNPESYRAASLILASSNQLNLMHHARIKSNLLHFYERIRKNTDPGVSKRDPNYNLTSKILFIRLDAITYCRE